MPNKFEIRSAERCDKLLSKLKGARVLGMGAQGKAYVYDNDVVKQMNLGRYRGESREFVVAFTYRARYEVEAMKKLVNSGFAPRYIDSWKCFNETLRPLADNTDGKRLKRMTGTKGHYQGYIRMHRIHGQSLGDYLHNGGKITKRQMEQLCKAIYDMNIKYKIVHTDLHFGNIMRCKTGKLYIIDYGLAWRGRYDRLQDGEDLLAVRGYFQRMYDYGVRKADMERIFDKYLHKYRGLQTSSRSELDDLGTLVLSERKAPHKHLDRAFTETPKIVVRGRSPTSALRAILKSSSPRNKSAAAAPRKAPRANARKRAVKRKVAARRTSTGWYR